MKRCILCGAERNEIDISNDPFATFTEHKFDTLLRLLGLLNAEEIAVMADSLMNLAVVTDHEFERRFPKEHAKWEQKHD
jgi:hypothetical protein